MSVEIPHCNARINKEPARNGTNLERVIFKCESCIISRTAVGDRVNLVKEVAEIKLKNCDRFIVRNTG